MSRSRVIIVLIITYLLIIINYFENSDDEEGRLLKVNEKMKKIDLKLNDETKRLILLPEEIIKKILSPKAIINFKT